MAQPGRARIVISGMVQGVAYRQSAVWEAERLGLRGWVRNLPDGRVEALAEGPRERVESLVAWCWRGPPAARVSGVAVTWSEARGDLQAFSISR
jgi:acylphosphatase